MFDGIISMSRAKGAIHYPECLTMVKKRRCHRCWGVLSPMVGVFERLPATKSTGVGQVKVRREHSQAVDHQIADIGIWESRGEAWKVVD